MASSKKKRQINHDIGDATNGKEDADDVMINKDEEEMDTNEVQVDFEARCPADCDFHGIKKLLQQLFVKANINLSELADTLISQNYVGSVLLQALDDDDSDEEDDDMEVFGIMSVVNLTERKDLECVKQLKSYLADKCQQCDSQQKLTQLLEDPAKQVGFLLNERFINFPSQLCLPSFQSLWKDVERAKKKKMKYEFSDYLMICKVLKTPEKSQSKARDAFPQTVFVNVEEELFKQESSLSMDFSVKEERDSAVAGLWEPDDDDLEPCRTVLAIPAHKMAAIMDKLSEKYASLAGVQ